MAKILVIDDHAINRELVVALAGYAGHQAFEAGDGVEGLEIVRAERPRLVICDILMPNMDGYEFVRQLRADPEIADTPVIFYTANYHEREARNLAAILGVSRILVKPCDPERIVEAIDEALAQTANEPTRPSDAEFEREHLRVLTDKLAGKAGELEQANKRLAALTELNLKLSAERDTGVLLDKVCYGARELTGARYAILYVDGRNDGRKMYLLAYGLSDESSRQLRAGALDARIFERLVTERKPVRFVNSGGRPEGLGLPGDFPAVYCGVVAPIASAMSMFGWVCLFNKIGAGEFTAEDEWISGVHAAQAGHIYENWNLYGQLERRAGDLSNEIATRKLVEKQLRRVLRARKVMAECNRTLVRATDEARLLNDMCRFLVELGAYGMAWVGLAWHDADRTVETVAAAGDDAERMRKIRFSWGDNRFGRGPVGEAVRTREAQIVADLATDQRALRWREAGLLPDFRAAAVLPLTFEKETYGVLGIVTCEREAFDADELDLLRELADDIGYGIHTLRARVAQQRMEETLRLRNRALDESINAIVISAADQQADNPIIYVNAAFTLMTGYTPDEVIGRNTRMLIGGDLDQPDLERLREAVRRGRDARVTVRCYRKDGSQFWNEVSLASMHDPSGRVSHFISIFNDLTDHKRYEAELEQQANHDALTGLANRNLLNDRLQQAMIHAQRNNGAVAVMLLDVDRFKLINDSLGHATGDELICEVGRRLSSCVRQGDTVARLGGDEFMIVMSEPGTESDAVSLAAKLLQAVSAPMRLSGHDMVVTGSLGVALYPRDGETPATLVKNADVAMYRAKEQGRNDFRFYAPEMNARMLERLELENGLRRALEQGELELHYQPKVCIADGVVVGAEALIRWRHPELGMVSPVDFIPLAEETGLIVPIGEWVIHTACRQLRRWREEGLSDVSVAVNVSARQFQQDTLVGVLDDALRETGVPPAQLHLEVTESGVMDNPERTVVILRMLKDLGVSVSLDDFGTGYSSLNHLKRFLIDSVKIDQSFVADLTTSSEDAAIARMVISLAHSLNQTVVAEGVETEAQLDFLRRHRCDEMQGYLCSRPVPASDFATLVRSGGCLPPWKTVPLH